MATLQFIIDSICAKFTVNSMYELVKVRLKDGPVTIAEVARDIRCSDRSLDFDSSKKLAEAALEQLAERGDVIVDGDWVYPP